jgi:hypothetical protein
MMPDTTHSRYQSIDETHIYVHVKFESRLLIPFRRKMRCKKSGALSEIKMVLKIGTFFENVYF